MLRFTTWNLGGLEEIHGLYAILYIFLLIWGNRLTFVPMMYAQHFCLPGGIYDWADDLHVAQDTVIGGSLEPFAWVW